MKKFKMIIECVCTSFGGAILGNAIVRTFLHDYKSATILLYIVSVLFIVSYFTERFSE